MLSRTQSIENWGTFRNADKTYMRLSTLALCSALLSGTAFADKQPETSHLPAAVQQRIKEYNAEGDLKKIKTRKQKDGSTVYEVEYKERGNTEMLVLAEDGSVISESSGKGKSNAKGKGQAKKQDNKGKGKGKGDRNEVARDEEAEEKDDDDLKKTAPVPAKSRPVATQPSSAESAPVPPATTPASPKPTDTTVNAPTGTAPSGSAPSRPVGTPTTRPTSPTVRPVAIDRLIGETRYVYWDNIPEPVRKAALAQQAQQGAANVKLLRVQKKGGKSIFHIPFEKASVSFAEDGSIAVPADANGGPMRTTNWDDLPEPVRKNALAAQSVNGDANARVISYQSNGGKSLYHILFAKEMVNAYSQDGKVQDPATYWK